MDSPQTLAGLDRLRETQLQIHSEIHRHGELLHDLVELQKRVVLLQERTANAMTSINRGKGFTPPVKSPPSSKVIAPDVIQWAVAVAAITYVLKGGDPGLLLKALGF